MLSRLKLVLRSYFEGDWTSWNIVNLLVIVIGFDAL
jgi:hypothetical protein